MIRVVFVPTAGAKKEIWRNNKKLSFLYNWPIVKWYYKNLGDIEVKFIPELKIETIARLKKAYKLYFEGRVDFIAVIGGYSPLRQTKQVADLMKEWLVKEGVPEDKIAALGQSVQTSGNVEELVNWLKMFENVSIIIHVVTSHYHMLRTVSYLEKQVKKLNVKIKRHKVYPPIALNCLKDEYLFNLLFEPIKIIAMIIGFEKTYEKIERRARENYNIKK